MRLIVGLGNPGAEYAGTRHNVGYMLVDALAQRLGWVRGSGEFERKARSKFDGLAMDGPVTLGDGRGEKLLLLKPSTFMNLSGRAVQAAAGFYQLPLDDVLVVLDDMALPTGKIRLRPGGSAGGHNGLKDIERALGTSEYPRLRIGIDSPPMPMAWRDYVLSPVPADQRARLQTGIDKATGAAMLWMEKGMTAAMNQFNAAEEKM